MAKAQEEERHPIDQTPSKDTELTTSVDIEWYSFKEILGETARNSANKLSREGYDEFMRRGGSLQHLDELYNVGHPFRWPRDFPGRFSVNFPGAHTLGEHIELTLPFSSLLTQVATHLDSWKPKIINRYETEYVGSAKKIANAYRALADLVGDRKIVVVMAGRRGAEGAFDVDAIR